ncbi:hypothetical protein HBH61_235210 [Parastagonospora nodorum]|nr:hypothetical protein HBH61_235210 [Parastagonospora nodorum]
MGMLRKKLPKKPLCRPLDQMDLDYTKAQVQKVHKEALKAAATADRIMRAKGARSLERRSKWAHRRANPDKNATPPLPPDTNPSADPNFSFVSSLKAKSPSNPSASQSSTPWWRRIFKFRRSSEKSCEPMFSSPTRAHSIQEPVIPLCVSCSQAANLVRPEPRSATLEAPEEGAHSPKYWMDYEKRTAQENQPLITSVMQSPNEAHRSQYPRFRVLSAGTKNGEPFTTVLPDTDQLNNQSSAVLNDQMAETRNHEQGVQSTLLPDASSEHQASSMRHPAAELGLGNVSRPNVPQKVEDFNPDASTHLEGSHNPSIGAPLCPTKSYSTFITNPYLGLPIHSYHSTGRDAVGQALLDDPYSNVRVHSDELTRRDAFEQDPLDDQYSPLSSADSHFAIPIKRRKDSASATPPQRRNQNTANVTAPPPPDVERKDL